VRDSRRNCTPGVASAKTTLLRSPVSWVKNAYSVGVAYLKKAKECILQLHRSESLQIASRETLSCSSYGPLNFWSPL